MAQHFSKSSLRVLASLILGCVCLEFVSRHILFIPEFDIIIALILAYLSLRFNALVGVVFAIFGVVFLSNFHQWHEIDLELPGKMVFWIGMLGSILSVVAYYKTTIVREERRQAELSQQSLEVKIKEKAHELMALTELLPQIVWRTNKQGEITYMNQRWTEFTGEPVGTPNWAKLIHPDDLESVAASWRAAVGNPVPYSVETRMKAKDGSYRWFISRGAPVLDENGQIESWVGAFTDINDARVAMEEIRDSELRFISTINESPFAMMAVRQNGSISRVNEAWLKLWNYPKHAIQNHLYNGFCLFEHEQESIKIMSADILRVFAGERVGGREVYFDPSVSGDLGRARWTDVHLSPIYSGGKLTEVLVTYNDITDRKLSEIAASENQRQLRQLTEALPQMVWTADVHGSVDYYNERWVEYTGWSKERLGKWNWRPLIHVDDVDEFIVKWTMSVITGNNFDAQMRIKEGKSGEYRWHLVRGICLRDENGRALKWFGTTTDIQNERDNSARIALAESKSRNVVSSAAMTLWSADRLGKFTYNEGEGFSLLGVQPGEWIGKSIYDVQSQRPQVIDAFEEALRGNPQRVILVIGDHSFECAFSPLKDDNGEIIGVVGAGLEVTTPSQNPEVSNSRAS